MEEGHLNIHPQEYDGSNDEVHSAKDAFTGSKSEHRLQDEEFCIQLEQEGPVSHVHSDGDCIVTIGPGHKVMVWDMKGKFLARWRSEHSGPITGVFIHCGTSTSVGPLVITSSYDGTIKQCALKTGKELWSIDTMCPITCMASFLSWLLVTGNDRGQLDVRNSENGKMYKSKKAHTDSIHALAVSNNIVCTYLIGKPCSIKLWSFQYGGVNCVYSFDLPHYVDANGSIGLSGHMVFMCMRSIFSRIYLLDFELEESRECNLSEGVGGIRCLAVKCGMLLAAVEDKNNKVSIYVYKEPELKLLRVLPTSMEHVTAMTLFEDRKCLKLILVGSSLAVMKLERISGNEHQARSMMIQKHEDNNVQFISSMPPPSVLEHEGAGDTQVPPEVICSKPWTSKLDREIKDDDEKLNVKSLDVDSRDERTNSKAVLKQLDELLTENCFLKEEMKKFFEKTQTESALKQESIDSSSDGEVTKGEATQNWKMSEVTDSILKMDKTRETSRKLAEESDTDSSIEENLDVLPLEEYTDEFRAALRRAEENNPFRKKVLPVENTALNVDCTESGTSPDHMKLGNKFGCKNKYSKLKKEEVKKSKTKRCLLM